MKTGMSRVRRNLAANLVGTGWVALLQLALVPVFLKLLGTEVYGLVGLYTSLQMVFLMFDMGLGTAVNRELARLAAGTGDEGSPATLFRTLEVVYATLALLLALVLSAAASWFASTWVHAASMSAEAVVTSLRLIGCMIAAQFPFALYSGVLLGLQRHVRLNVVTVAGASLRLLAVLPVLLFVSRDATVFFAWQLGATVVQTLAMRMLAQRAISADFRPRGSKTFDFPAVFRLRRFAAGLTGVSVLGAVVFQIDKLAVTRHGSLDILGYYSVASTMAGAASLAAGPVFSTIFPRFSEIMARRDDAAFASALHAASQTLSVLLMPMCAVLVLYSTDVLRLWTSNAAVAAAAGPVLAFLMIATSANAVAHVPWAAQLSVAWTRFGLLLNVAAVLLVGPAAFLVMPAAGPRGVAMAVCVWHVTALAVSALVTFRRLAPAELGRWVAIDVGLPAVVAFLVAAGFKALVTGHAASTLTQIVIVSALTLGLTAAASPLVRLSLLAFIRTRSER